MFPKVLLPSQMSRVNHVLPYQFMERCRALSHLWKTGRYSEDEVRGPSPGASRGRNTLSVQFSLFSSSLVLQNPGDKGRHEGGTDTHCTGCLWFSETETCFSMRDARNALPMPAYQLLVLRRMLLLNMTSRRAVVWRPSCQTGWQSAAWQSRWTRRHRPPWEGERAGLGNQLHHNSLRWESIRDTHTHTAVMHCL